MTTFTTRRYMQIYLNNDDSTGPEWNKKKYLQAAAKRLGIYWVDDIKNYPGPHDYILNIQPCEILKGSRWTGLWHIDVSLDSDFPDYYKDVDTVFVSSSVGIRPYKKEIVMFQACDPTFYTPKEQTHDFYREADRIFTLLGKRPIIIPCKIELIDEDIDPMSNQPNHLPDREEIINRCQKLA